MTRSVEIPDAAVQAARLAYSEACKDTWHQDAASRFRAALAAALPYLAPAEVIDQEAIEQDRARMVVVTAKAIQQGQAAGQEQDAVPLTRSEIRDEVDELIRNAYAEGWREAQRRPDAEPPLLEIDWTQPGGVRITPAGLCACGKPAAHVDADPDDADWACRVPVGDGGLREALAALVKEWRWQGDMRPWQEGGGPDAYEGGLDDAAAKLRATLAAHPVAPAVPQPVDREVLATQERTDARPGWLQKMAKDVNARQATPEQLAAEVVDLAASYDVPNALVVICDAFDRRNP